MKKTFVLHVSIAAALCVAGFAMPAAADGGRISPPAARPGLAPFLPQTTAPLEPREADLTTAPTATLPATPAPARAAPQARSYPRSFTTYEELVDYATSVASAQQAASDRLVALAARVDADRAELATVFDPRVRGGLLQSRAQLMDDATVGALRAEVASDAAAQQQLVADGVVLAPHAAWQMPLQGEDTQDFGPTPYYFEPSLTYSGVYYAHFHTGTDIATAWGTPILAPARGLVVFSGTMGDGAEVVVMTHESGLVSMYAHLDNYVFPVPVRAGDTVQAGDRIGNVGLTGITTGAHLHWSVWRNGELIDPLSLIAKP
jgi:murein DD-endopeptidase MepM/ murein hydrolase activator NlpD